MSLEGFSQGVVVQGQSADPAVRIQQAGAELEQFQQLMLDLIDNLGLPTDSTVVPVAERRRLLKNVDDAIEGLGPEQRARSPYISKMILAASVGLFDAALSYLWNETINELRARVAGFDVAYFFDLAETDPAKRKELKDADDLKKLEDARLMEAAHRIQLISDVGYRQLDHIRYMRNNASAAHPNQNSITGLMLAEWLETCIREVITLPKNTVVAQIGRLLHNIKTQRLSPEEIDAAAAFFDNLPQDQADNLGAGFFGIFVDPASTPQTLDNIRGLWPELWECLSEESKNDCGVKLARFRANADQDRAEKARSLLDLVDGFAYLPEVERTAELAQALDDLMSAHEGWNNFYNEPPVARRLLNLVGHYGSVPTQLRQRYVLDLVYVFLSNGHGIANSADPQYRELIQQFDEPQASIALRSFTTEKISSRLHTSLARQQWAELLLLLSPKFTGRRDRALLRVVQDFTSTPDKLCSDSTIKQHLSVYRPAIKRKRNP